MENNSPPVLVATPRPIPFVDRLRFALKAGLAMWRLTAKPVIPGAHLSMTYRVEIEG